MNADQDTLQPDILTGFDEDALEVVLGIWRIGRARHMGKLR